MKYKILMTYALFLCACVKAYAEDKIRFVIPNYPPYTTEIDGKPSGTAVTTMEKILAEAGLAYGVTVVPNYGRAIEDTKKGEADGFFYASRNSERDDIAVFSKPLTMNSWAWFSLKKSAVKTDAANFKETARIGALLNSNPHKWLSQNGYKVTGTPSDDDALLKMLQSNRMDVIFVAQTVFLHTIDTAGLKREDFDMKVEVPQPFGVYLSKKYLEKNPKALEKLNSAIEKNIKL